MEALILTLNQDIANEMAADSVRVRRRKCDFGRGAPLRESARSLLFLLVLALAWLAPGPAAEAADQPVVSVQRGVATYYAGRFHGRRTASGERLNQRAMVAAHPSLPFGTIVRVTNLRNGLSTEVRVVDRGPAKGPQRRGVIIDLTQGAARELDFTRRGRVPVRVDVLGHDEPGSDTLPGEGDESPA